MRKIEKKKMKIMRKEKGWQSIKTQQCIEFSWRFFANCHTICCVMFLHFERSVYEEITYPLAHLLLQYWNLQHLLLLSEVPKRYDDEYDSVIQSPPILFATCDSCIWKCPSKSRNFSTSYSICCFEQISSKMKLENDI